MRAVWLTDIHLDFLSSHARQDFLAVVASKHPDVVFLTGDVSIALKSAVPSTSRSILGLAITISIKGPLQTCEPQFEISAVPIHYSTTSRTQAW
jgi:hypothetical protein